MAGVVLVSPRTKFTNSAGVPIVGGSVTVYYAGTTSLATTYQDKALTTANTNPIILDANGECLLWVSSDNNYKLLLKDASGATVSGYPVDDIPGAANTADAAEAASDAAVAAVEASTRPLNYNGVVFGWNSDAGLSGARFPAFDKVGPGLLWASYSPRHSSVTDGELGMRLEVVELTYDDEAETVTPGTPSTVATPTDFTSGLGAVWNCGFHVMQSGSNVGRKIIVAQELNTPDGTYSHIDSRYDVVIYYTDDEVLPATWTRVLLLAGQSAHTTFGLVDYNAAAAGMHVPSGNCIVEMPNGRLVIIGYIPEGANGHYLASLYTDDPSGVAGWTAGTPLAYSDLDDNEPSICLTEDGVAAFVRNESTNKRNIYLSTDGATWTYSRAATDVPIRNVANCAVQNSVGRVFVGGATTVTALGAAGAMVSDNRRGWKLYPSDNDGATFGAGISIFEEEQRVGYSCMRDLGFGSYGLIFEATATQTGESFNQKPSLGFARFNDATVEGVIATNQPLHDGLRYTAAEEYSKYETYVTDDGGTVQDATATLAAITSAIGGNYYSKIGIAVSGRWGHKGLGTATCYLYSLNRIKNTGNINNGFITLDTGTYSYAVVVIPGGAEFTFGATPIHLGNAWGAVLCDKKSDVSSGAGVGFQWTNSVTHYVFAGGTAYFGENVATGSPHYGLTQADAAHFHFNMEGRVCYAGLNGITRQSPYYFPKYSTNGQTVSMRLHPVATGPRHLAEAWHFSGVGITPEMVRQCSEDVEARS